MRRFDYTFLKDVGFSMSILNLVGRIESLKEKDVNRIRSFPNTYHGMESAARMQSIFGSNAIEGIFTTDDRLKEICERKVEPKGHDEAEIAGYRDALDLIHREYGSINIDERTILELHRIMLSHSDYEGGSWKETDNFIGHVNEDGTVEVHFETVSAKDTPKAMEQLILAYRMAYQDASINRLMLIPCFILDFLSIHPFLDGNGRTSRLLTLLMLYKEGYDVGRYVSIEQKIYANRPGYYEALTESSKGWHEGNNDYMPFIRNFIEILFLCYRELDRRFMTAVGSKENKTERVKYAVLNSLLPISKRDLKDNLPDISEATIVLVLNGLVKDGLVEKVGSGPSVRYRRK